MTSTPQVEFTIAVTSLLTKITLHTCQHHLVQHSSRTVCHWERQTACFQETVLASLVLLMELSTSVWVVVHPLRSSANTYSCLIGCNLSNRTILYLLIQSYYCVYQRGISWGKKKYYFTVFSVPG